MPLEQKLKKRMGILALKDLIKLKEAKMTLNANFIQNN